MSRVHELLQITTASTADVEGDQFNLQMRQDESGAIQYACTAGSCAEIELQGRLDSSLGWMEIATSGAMDSSGTNNVVSTNVSMLPQMRAVLKTPTSGCVVWVYLME